MNDTKFTKGEWKLTTQFQLNINSGFMTTQMTGDKFAPVSEREANAHLIAASPDMYAMLEDSRTMLMAFHKNTGSMGAIAQVRFIDDLLKKARGD